MKRRTFIQSCAAGALTVFGGWRPGIRAVEAVDLERTFRNPPASVRPSGYWWWFDDLMDKKAITHNLEEFKAKGVGGAMIVCSRNGSDEDLMPRGPEFLSPAWRELYKFALQEANRLKLELGVNFCGGWDMGGPWITPENSGRWLLQSQMTVTGPQRFSGKLPLPDPKDGYDSKPQGIAAIFIDLPLDKADYRDTATVAFREPAGNARLGDERSKSLAAKSNRLDANCFFPARQAMDQTLTPWTALPNDTPMAPTDVIDLTSKLGPNGELDWDVPEGSWTIVRTGHRMTGFRVHVSMPDGDPKDLQDLLHRMSEPARGSDGLEVDWLSTESVDQQWEHLGNILLADAGPLVGTTLKFFATDSFEDGYPNWTAKMLEKFQHYRGYDPKPFLPVFAGYLVGSAEISDRFLYDYRKTVADCMADNYQRFAELAHQHGLSINCEAAGPSWSGTMCMDGLKNLGRCDMPQGEFWQDSTFVVDGQNKVTKQTATAAHIYGRRTASAEAFTSFLRAWGDSPASLKPTADRAFCEGINRFVFHTMTATRQQDGLPGYEYGAGTHFNPNVTWWQQAATPWLNYVSRCQLLLQSGLFVADVLYYNGDNAPNLVEPKHWDHSLGKGYDYDVCNSEVLLMRLSVKDGRLVLPDGMSYHLLILPKRAQMPAEIIQKLRQLVEAGATIVGPKPESDPGLRDYPQCDKVVRQVASELWGAGDGKDITERKFHKGRVIWGKSPSHVLEADGIPPDLEVAGGNTGTFIDYIHRTTPNAEIYFLANRKNSPETIKATFRVGGRQPELWDPISGKQRDLPDFAQQEGRTTVPLEFEPHGSMFVIFRRPAIARQPARVMNFPGVKPLHEIAGPWSVQFDPTWFYPTDATQGEQAAGKFIFQKLDDWATRPEAAIKYFSGTATYRSQFEWTGGDSGSKSIFLDLGIVKVTAAVRLNGKDLGVLWCSPWRVEVSRELRPGQNTIEIDVVNLWPNRLVGDTLLPAGERRTHTNIRTKPQEPLLSSGLLGPVQLMPME
jgi:hypothetical protein